MEKLRIRIMIVTGLILLLMTSGAYAERGKGFAERKTFSADQWLVEETTEPLFNLSSNDFLSMSDGLLSRIVDSNDIGGDFATDADVKQNDLVRNGNDVPMGDGLLPLVLIALAWSVGARFHTKQTKIKHNLNN